MAQRSTRKKTSESPKETFSESPEDTAEGLSKLAEGQLEMARLFIDRGKNDIARRRLDEILEVYPMSAAAIEARRLLKRL